MIRKALSKRWWESRTLWANAITTLIGVLGVVSGQEWMADHPQIVAGIVTAIGLLNVALRWVTIGRVTLAFLLCVSVANADTFQLMPQEKYQRCLSLIPKLDEAGTPNLMAKLRQGFFYDSETIPSVIQFQPLIGGTGANYTLFFSRTNRFNNIDRTSNPNLEPPWDKPGGIETCDQNMVEHFKILWLPPQPDGKPWPLVWHIGPLRKSNAVNMPVPNGWRCTLPVDALIVEVHTKRFTDGTELAYEVRMRLREIDDHDIEVFRPIVDANELLDLTGDPNILATAGVIEGHKRDRHPNPSFDRRGYVFTLPPLPNAKEILRNQTFKPVSGTSLTRTRDWHVESMTARDHDNIAPAGYDSAYLGTTRESCVNCHQDVGKHADDADPSRDWYSYIGGGIGEGLFRVPGPDPACVRPAGRGETRLDPRLVEAGIVAMFDPKIHPESIYQVISHFANHPDQTPARSNRRIVGGEFR